MAALEPAPPAACDVQSAPAAHTGHRRPEMLSIAVPGRPDPTVRMAQPANRAISTGARVSPGTDRAIPVWV